MKIQSINNYSYIPSYKGFLKKPAEQKPCDDRCLIQKQEMPHNVANSARQEGIFFCEFLTRKGKVSKKEYDEIVKKHPSAIAKGYKYIEDYKSTSSSPKEIAKAALRLKESYDKEYKGKYLIASIGTSPSPITEVMSALGARVVFIPASGLNTLQNDKMYIFRAQYPTVASRNPNIKYIVDYTKKNISGLKKDEFLVLLDYCCSGTSLDNLCSVFEEENIHPSGQIHDRSILSDLCELTNLKDTNSDFMLEEYAHIVHDMQYSCCEEVSNVPHFNIYDQYNEGIKNHVSSQGKRKRQLFKEFDEFSKPLARAYSLCAIHEAMKMLKNENSTN